MSTVRVIDACVVVHDGSPTPLRKDAAYESDDPIVRQFPHLFAWDNDGDVVEQATATPGQKRNARQ